MTRGFTLDLDSVDEDKLPYCTATSKDTVPGSSASNRATTALLLDATTTALPACATAAPLIDAGLTAMGLTNMVTVLVVDVQGVPPGVGLPASTNAVALSCQMCNATLVSGLDMRQPTAIWLLLLFLSIAASKWICESRSAIPSRRNGLLIGRTGLVVSLGCLARLYVLIARTTTSHLTTLTWLWIGNAGRSPLINSTRND
jgi:hypothetical protein